MVWVPQVGSGSCGYDDGEPVVVSVAGDPATAVLVAMATLEVLEWRLLWVMRRVLVFATASHVML